MMKSVIDIMKRQNSVLDDELTSNHWNTFGLSATRSFCHCKVFYFLSCFYYCMRWIITGTAKSTYRRCSAQFDSAAPRRSYPAVTRRRRRTKPRTDERKRVTWQRPNQLITPPSANNNFSKLTGLFHLSFFIRQLHKIVRLFFSSFLI